MSLAARNTVRMVADYWGCSPKTVRRMIDRGELPALRLGGIVRLTREAVEGFEQQCSFGGIRTGDGMSCTARGSKDGYQRGKQAGAALKPFSPSS